MKTNVGAKFLKIINKTFDQQNPLKKIFNRNTVKISYRCMPHMKSAVANHNSSIMCSPKSTEDKKCKCEGDQIACRAENVIYKDEVKSSKETEVSTGLTSRPLKTRMKEHDKDFVDYFRKGTHTKHLYRGTERGRHQL